ncbi:MAG: polysaccharide deacetylase family protein [Bacteriovoracaceae bacterium]
MKKIPYLVLASIFFSACAHYSPVVSNKGNEDLHVARFIAGHLDEEKGLLQNSLISTNEMKQKVQSFGKRLFQSYLHGQVFLKSFDKELNRLVRKKNKGKKDILMSNVYADLLATRSLVDEVEERMLDYYLFYAKTYAHPQSSLLAKENAQIMLKEIGVFLTGQLGLGEIIPPTLRPMVLSNLIEKQTTLDAILKDLSEDDSFTLGDSDSRAALFELRVQIRRTRIDFNREVRNSKIDEKEFDRALKKEKKKSDFNQLEKEIQTLGDEMLVIQEEARRVPSSDPVIFPSAGANGNITGNGFPENTWSITYDDGPGGATTPTVLQNLKDRGVKATFFQLAQQVAALPKISKSIKDAGMDLASHSYTHAQLAKVGPIQLEKEITTAKSVSEQKLGITIKLFRLPYGAGVSVPSIRQKIADNKMVHVFWNVDTLDWQDKNPDSVVERSLNQIKALKKNAGIILFHDIHPQSVIASAKLIDVLKSRSTRLCTVQQVIDQINNGAETCVEVAPPVVPVVTPVATVVPTAVPTVAPIITPAVPVKIP